MCAVAQLHPILCSPMDCSLPGSSVHGIFQARILEWVAISYPEHLLDLGIEPVSLCISCVGRQILYHFATWKDNASYIILQILD